MKRVLIFSLAYYPHVGGAEVAVKEITDRIRDIEFDMVTMRFDSRDAREEHIGNVHVYRIGSGHSKFSKFLFQFRAARFASKLHRAHPYDATWALMAHSAGVPAALFKMRHKNIPYILNLQEGDPPQHIERTMLPLWPLFVRAFTTADIVQPLSTFLAQWARRMGYKGPVEIIPNGADIKRFAGEPIAHDGTVLITTSRLVHKNAIDDVIRALASLPEVTFKILGTGPDESALKKLSRDLGVESRVEFLGHVDHTDMPPYLHAADIFVRASRSEGQGASFIEAMAAGLPAIATQEGGLSDFISRDVAWPVAKDSPQQIADAVKEILSNPQETARRVANAKKLVFEKYDWDLIAKTMRERVFEPLVH